MGSPYLNMKAKRNDHTLEIWAQPEANLVAANTFILLNHASDCIVSFDLIYGSSDYFAYAEYVNSVGEYEERADYSVVISPNESIYLGFSSQSGTMIDSFTYGWVELGLDEDGKLTAFRSAWDMDGDPIRVGDIPEPSAALLLLMDGAMLALRRRKML